MPNSFRYLCHPEVSGVSVLVLNLLVLNYFQYFGKVGNLFNLYSKYPTRTSIFKKRNTELSFFGDGLVKRFLVSFVSGSKLPLVAGGTVSGFCCFRFKVSCCGGCIGFRFLLFQVQSLFLLWGIGFRFI